MQRSVAILCWCTLRVEKMNPIIDSEQRTSRYAKLYMKEVSGKWQKRVENQIIRIHVASANRKRVRARRAVEEVLSRNVAVAGMQIRYIQRSLVRAGLARRL
jgi:hypothetical protein